MQHNLETDKGISHQAALDNLKDTIKKVQEIDFDTTKIEEQVVIIEQELEKEIIDNYDKFGHEPTTQLLRDMLKNTYENATIKLNQLNQYLEQEYNMYYVIYNGCIDLESDLEKATQENLSSYIKEAKKLITNITRSSQMDYKMEANLVEKVYRITYQVLKLESIYTDSNDLLNYLKANDIDITYIKKYIEQDINKLDLHSNQNKEIYNLILDIKKQGISNINFLDKELIKLLALSSDEQLKEKKKESFLEECITISNCYTEITKLTQTREDISNQYKDLKQRKKKNTIHRIKSGLFLLGNFTTISVAAFGLFQGTKKWTADKTYQTTIETYDSSQGNHVDKKQPYRKATSNSTIITEYTPWIEPGYFREDYTREIYTYDITNLELAKKDIRDYLTKELMDYNEEIELNHTTETSPKEPAELYSENIYQIERITQNKEKVHLDPNQDKFQLLLAIEYGLLGLLEGVVLLITKKINSSTKKDRKQVKEELLTAERNLLECTKNLNNLISNYQNLQKHLQIEYDKLPSSLHENKKIKQRLKVLEDLSIKNQEENN